MLPAENRLINGDFEQAGPPGSSECGPGWLTDGGLTIVGAEGWWHDARPLNGSKAIGVAARNLIDQGRAEQNVEVKPGTYKVTATGHVWIDDTFCGDGITSYLEVRLARGWPHCAARKFEPNVQKKWFTVRYDWHGRATPASAWS